MMTLHVALTYDLRADYLAQGYDAETTAEFDSPETIAALEAALMRRGCRVTRVGHIQHLVHRLAQGERWDLALNIAEGLHGLAREAQIPALLEAYQIPYIFSDALTLALTLDKALTKRVVRDAGLPTAAFAVLASPADLQAHGLAYPLFVKPLAEGTGKGISAASQVQAAEALALVCQTLWARYHQPVLAETYLPGRELTVGILGTGASARVLGVMEVRYQAQAEAGGYTYANKEHYEDRVQYQLVTDDLAQQAAAVALAAWQLLRCRDAGRVDLRADAAGVAQFLEVNPLAGLHPVRSDLVILARLTGWTAEQLLDAILDAAWQRLGLA